ncbi:putative amidophosphoribosyltransferase [Psychrobacter sp. PL15]|uniref:ComF family protein n=1 Tax=Psychrobacter sp. PL15 TaxID=3071719 RepID=UPI002E0433E0|nr:putative amidophosphoribosyltransferase [Psychrobacter sp. PL15]
MRRLAPYQSGLWLAEYLRVSCQLCRIYRSAPQPYPQLTTENPPHTDILHTLRTNHSFIANLRRRFNNRFSSGLLCPRCHNSIAWLPEPFHVDLAAGTALPIQAATYYDYPIRQVIRAFKQHEDMTKLPLLLHILRQLPRPHGCHRDNSVIVAMPTTNQRLIKRGFDPVSILSAQLSKHWQIPLWQGIQRVDDTISQQGLSRAERLSNLNDAFALTENPPVKRFLLFDDVATTGASLQALGRTLYDQSTGSSEANSHISSNPTNAYHLSAYTLAHGSQ